MRNRITFSEVDNVFHQMMIRSRDDEENNFSYGYHDKKTLHLTKQERGGGFGGNSRVTFSEVGNEFHQMTIRGWYGNDSDMGDG